MKLFKTIIYLSYPLMLAVVLPILVAIMNNSENSVVSSSFERLFFVTIGVPFALAITAGYYRLPFKTFFSGDSLIVAVYVLIDVIGVVVGFKIHNSHIIDTAIMITGGVVSFTLSYVIISMATAYSFIWVMYTGAFLCKTPIKSRS